MYFKQMAFTRLEWKTFVKASPYWKSCSLYFWDHVLQDRVLEGATMNRHYYNEISTKTSEKNQIKGPELRQNNFIPHQDNASARTVFSVKQFLADKYITTMGYPSYSPNFRSCHFYHSLKVKSIKKKMVNVLKQLT